MNFSAESKDCKKFETKTKTIAINVLFSSSNREEKKQVYILKDNSGWGNKIILIIITEGKK